MSSNVDCLPAHQLSQETRDPASMENPLHNLSQEAVQEDPNSKRLANSKSELRLPLLKAGSKQGGSSSTAYLKPHDRLYLEHRSSYRYGKRTEMLAEIASLIVEPKTLDDLKNKDNKDKSPLRRDPFKGARNVPIHEAIAIRREIFLTRYSIEAKTAAVEDLKKYVEMKEEELNRQVKLSQESRALFQQYIQEENKKIKELRDLKAKLEDEKHFLSDQIVVSKNELDFIDRETRKVKEDIEEMKMYEAFVESMAIGSYPETIAEIKAYNKKIEDARKAEKEQIDKQAKYLAVSKKTGSFMRRGKLIKSNSKIFDGKPEKGLVDRPSNIFLTGAAGGGSYRSMGSSVTEKSQGELSQGDPHSSSVLATIQEQEPRTYLELYPEPSDFLALLKRIEDDCLNSMYHINSLDEDIRENNNAFTKILTKLEQEKELIKGDLGILKERQKSLQEQVALKKGSLRKCDDPLPELRPELSDKDIVVAFAQITQLAYEMDVTDKKYKKPEDHTFAEIVEYLKDLTVLYKQLEGLNEKAREDDKKEYESIVREIIREKRERIRIEQELKLAEEGRIKEQLKAKREADIKRKLKGRKGKARMWLPKDDSGDKDSSVEDPEAENKYWRMDDDYS